MRERAALDALTRRLRPDELRRARAEAERLRQATARPLPLDEE